MNNHLFHFIPLLNLSGCVVDTLQPLLILSGCVVDTFQPLLDTNGLAVDALRPLDILYSRNLNARMQMSSRLFELLLSLLPLPQ